MKKVIEKAAVIVHWPSGPVHACLNHAKQLHALASYMGAYVHVEPYSGDEPCTNCANAERDPGRPVPHHGSGPDNQ